MDNVIKFPKKNGRIGDSPTDAAEVEDKILNLKHHHINETLSTIIPSLFAQIDASGFELEDPENEDFDDMKDGAFLVEALRSLLCKHYGIHHPFQDLATKIFTPMSDGENTVFKVVDKLEIVFNNGNGDNEETTES